MLIFCRMPIKMRWGIVAIDKVLVHLLMGAWALEAELLSSKHHGKPDRCSPSLQLLLNLRKTLKPHKMIEKKLLPSFLINVDGLLVVSLSLVLSTSLNSPLMLQLCSGCHDGSSALHCLPGPVACLMPYSGPLTPLYNMRQLDIKPNGPLTHRCPPGSQ